MAGATRAANKRAATNTAAPDENIETITPAEEVNAPATRNRLDPAAVTFGSSEVVEVDPKSRGGIKFGEDHPLYLDYKKSYEDVQVHRLTTDDPETLVKGLRKIAAQLGTGVRIVSKDEGSVTYLAQEKRTRRSSEELAAEKSVAEEAATAE